MLSPSRRFLYHVELGLDSDLGSDAGSTLESGLQALLTYGICAEKTCPYVDNEEIVCQQLPPSAAFVEAAQNKLPMGTVMHVPLQISLFKRALADGLPLAVGIMVYSSFETPVVTQSGIIPLPNKATEQCLGGHAVCLCGYDDSKQAFLLKNSWGPRWALQGHAWLPYTYVSDSQLTSDAVCLASQV
jgi:C1A family cysteine protease